MSVRGTIVSPAGDGLRFEEDGVLCWTGGVFDERASGEPPLERVDGDPLLLVPGFVDAHIHLPQFRVRGQFQDSLLPWLRESIWPEEERFAEESYRRGVASEFRDALVAAGTTSALVYGSPHELSAWCVLEDLAPLCVRGGDVLMDRNSPGGLARETATALAESRDHAARWGERYALTPRFVPTCTTELLEGLGELATEHPVLIQSHVAENLDEVAWVAELHPEARSYLDVYEQAGLLGARTVLGHGIHLDDADLSRLVATGTWIAHCPTSNVALGSGRMPYGRMRDAGVAMALATDVGAGPDVSMLDVIACFLEVQRSVRGVDPVLGLRLATQAGARAMGEGSRRGELLAGRAADLVALRLPGGLRRGEGANEAFARVLSTFQGRWDEAIAGVWIGGEAMTPS
ncbi:MAG: amidohydrolase family protein [Deltaproteobacteria bacterium]|nr:amidohydrolase family protein [Deltaproteobacteria bacterium]